MTEHQQQQLLHSSSSSSRDNADGTMTTTTTTTTFQLLVWPRKCRNIEKSGYVLGWVYNKCDESRPRQRQTIKKVICAGILPFTKSFDEYNKVLQNIKELHSIQRYSAANDTEPQDQEHTSRPKPSLSGLSKSVVCTCPWKSLQIVAIWDPSNKYRNSRRSRNNNNNKNNNNNRMTKISLYQPNDPTTANKLPYISLIRRYPWWVDDDDDDDQDPSTTKANASTTNQTTKTRKQEQQQQQQQKKHRQQGQLLYYDLHNCKTKNNFAYLAVDYPKVSKASAAAAAATTNTTNGTEWSDMLTKINYGQTVCDIIESGRIPPLPSTIQSNIITDRSVSTSQNKDTVDEIKSLHSDNNDEKDKDVPPNGWKRIGRLLFHQSFTMLHFYKICCQNCHSGKNDVIHINKNSNSILTQGWNILPFFTWFRLLQLLRRRQRSDGTTIPKQQQQIVCCPQCLKPSCIQSPSQLGKHHMEYWNQVLTALLDVILGGFVAWYIIRNAGAISRSYIETKSELWTILENNIAWLESFPAGFKLNVPLTNNLGNEIRNWIHIHQTLLSNSLSSITFFQSYLLPILAAMGCVCGWSSFLAIAVDIWKLEMLHITVLALCFRALYRAELYLLSALFRLFRGKKRNVLRHRTDSMEYDAMQLLVGTICFCICIFLWTTIMVYYSFFISLNIALNVPVITFWLLYCMTYNGGSMPNWICLFYWRSRHPEWFSNSVHVKELLDDGTVSILRLVSVPASFSSVLSSCVAPHVSRLFAWLVPFGLQVLIPTGTASPCSMPLQKFAKVEE